VDGWWGLDSGAGPDAVRRCVPWEIEREAAARRGAIQGLFGEGESPTPAADKPAVVDMATSLVGSAWTSP
jgi:hypothetical protein